jgi:hypothetical protein
MTPSYEDRSARVSRRDDAAECDEVSLDLFEALGVIHARLNQLGQSFTAQSPP